MKAAGDSSLAAVVRHRLARRVEEKRRQKKCSDTPKQDSKQPKPARALSQPPQSSKPCFLWAEAPAAEGNSRRLGARRLSSDCFGIQGSNSNSADTESSFEGGGLPESYDPDLLALHRKRNRKTRDMPSSLISNILILIPMLIIKKIISLQQGPRPEIKIKNNNQPDSVIGQKNNS